jgi:O-antigen ligase
LTLLAPSLPRAAINAKSIALIATTAVSIGVLLSGFVLNEPAPYELYMVVLIAVWALFGLKISRSVAPLLVLLVTFNIGGFISMTQMADIKDTPLYLAVSLFLALTSVFFAAVIEARPALFRPIFLCWLAAGVSTSALGILGYFNAFPGADVFTRYERASGAFQDPNVFGPFLALPATYLLYRMLTGRPHLMPVYAAPLLVVMGGIFFSFSRGAWGLFGLSAALLMAALFIGNASGRFRLRIVLMGVLAISLLVLALLVALQIPGVAEVFTSRAHSLVAGIRRRPQSRPLRRATPWALQLAMEHPFGIGPLVFGKIFFEDTHNIWLKALLDYGWLGFASWLIMVIWTAAGGLRILFRNRPWQPYLLCAYVVFVGHVGLGSVIDTDHWRHLYLLIGLIWGCMALEARHQRATHRQRATPEPNASPVRVAA